MSPQDEGERRAVEKEQKHLLPCHIAPGGEKHYILQRERVEVSLNTPLAPTMCPFLSLLWHICSDLQLLLLLLHVGQEILI